MIIPVANLSGSSTQGLSIDSLFKTRRIGRDVSAHTLNNSATTTSIYSCKVPANSLGTDGILRTRILGEYWHDVGAAASFNLRIGLSTTTMYQDTTATFTASATSRPVFMQLDLVNNGATNSQVLGGKMEVGAPGATTGQGDAATAATVDVVIRGTAAVDTTSDSTFDVFIAHSTASAHITYAGFYGYSELL
jgi:hypothetical protein